MNKINSPSLLLYELNEIPPNLLNYYINLRPKSHLAKLRRESKYFPTYTRDEGELHPWSTWPTIHRGVPNSIHNIRYINQDLTSSQNFPPIWEILASNGIDIGIFGSLQSYPPIDRPEVKFYVPDTFSPEPKTYPEYLSNFQKFNLNLSKSNKAISGKIENKFIYQFIGLIKDRQISPLTALKCINHLAKESINKSYKKRRSLMQPVLGFDVFWSEYKSKRPQFATFFTNHVAGMMHRYWRDLFPGDFTNNEIEISSFNSKSIIKALDIADQQIGIIYKYADQNSIDLWILSSMGQEAIDRGEYIPDTNLENFGSLIKSLDLDVNKYSLLPAMQPDICISCASKTNLDQLKVGLNSLFDNNNSQIITQPYPSIGLTVNLSLKRSAKLVETEKVIYKSMEFPMQKFGLGIIKKEQGTGYHIPDGIFLARGPISKSIKFTENEKIDTCLIAPLILNNFNITPPEWMIQGNNSC
tara:strand:- start:3157 stop:4569 length:1413 start_codon:yes stop_codon:yes gene_type:complete